MKSLSGISFFSVLEVTPDFKMLSFPVEKHAKEKPVSIQPAVLRKNIAHLSKRSFQDYDKYLVSNKRF